MALLPQERYKQYALLVGIAAIALGYAFFEYWYTPRAEVVERLEVRLEALQDQNRRAQVIAARGGPELEERLAVYERHLARMEELIPRTGEVPALLNTITSQANRYGVVMGSLRPEPLVEGEHYTLESYQLTVLGEFHQVGQFLTSIASLERKGGILLAEPPTTSCGLRFVAREVSVGCRAGYDGLLQESIEQEAGVPRLPAVEAERELVQVSLEVFLSHYSLMCAEPPALEERGHTVNGRHDLGDCIFSCVNGREVMPGSDRGRPARSGSARRASPVRAGSNARLP